MFALVRLEARWARRQAIKAANIQSEVWSVSTGTAQGLGTTSQSGLITIRWSRQDPFKMADAHRRGETLKAELLKNFKTKTSLANRFYRRTERSRGQKTNFNPDLDN